jgi:MFS family permease
MANERDARVSKGGGRANGSEGLQRGVGLPAVVSLLLGTLGISTAYGMILLLPLYVQELGGNEADFGLVLSSATVTAVLCIGLLICHPKAMRPHAVVALAITIYALGAVGAASVSGGWMPLIGIGVLLGTAWAVVYTATPMVMSEIVTDEGRATYFGYLTGTQQVGIGAGPVIARFLAETDLGFRGTFFAAGIVCLFAVAPTVAVGFLTPDARGQRSSEQAAATGGEEATGEEETEVSFGEAIRRILRSEAAFSLVMILLFACLFTSLTQFQTTFASARQLDYSVFYVTYTVAVIASRFGLARLAFRFAARLVIAASVSVMALSVAAFFIVGSNALLYGMASAFVGLGYGLALPSVQAQAVNVSEDAIRSRVLPLAGLLFQAAILGFPVIAGWVIAGLGYQALFAVLVAFALIQAAIGWWCFSAVRRGVVAERVPQP